MSNGFREGFSDAVKGVVVGIVLSALLGVIKSLALVSSPYVGLIQLLEIVNLVGSIFLILAMESWAVGYLAGWLFGTWIMWTSGLAEYWLFVLYLIVGGLYFVVKFLQKVTDLLS